MEIIKYKTRIKGNTVLLPDAVLKKIDFDSEVEIIVRPLAFSNTSSKSINQVVEKIIEENRKKYPKLNLKINEKLKSLAGISADIDKQYPNYSDKEILGMERMKKYGERRTS